MSHNFPFAALVIGKTIATFHGAGLVLAGLLLLPTGGISGERPRFIAVEASPIAPIAAARERANRVGGCPC